LFGDEQQALIPLLLKNYVSRRERIHLDRVDKVLLVLPFLPIADLLSTLFSLERGGEEVGILARPVLEQYGAYGLVPLAASASMMFLVFMQVVIYIKRLFVNEWKVRWTKRVLTIPIYWLFVLEGVYVSTVIMNLLVPVAPQLTQIVLLRTLIVIAYFAWASILTLPQMKRLPCL